MRSRGRGSWAAVVRHAAIALAGLFVGIGCGTDRVTSTGARAPEVAAAALDFQVVPFPATAPSGLRRMLISEDGGGGGESAIPVIYYASVASISGKGTAITNNAISTGASTDVREGLSISARVQSTERIERSGQTTVELRPACSGIAICSWSHSYVTNCRTTATAVNVYSNHAAIVDGKIFSRPTAMADICDPPATGGGDYAGDGGGSSGGGGYTSCTEWVVEVSYDGGQTWNEIDRYWTCS